MIGQTIGGYKILEVLGRGGMGVVFKAVDTALDKVVALKSLDPVHAQSEQFLGRFRSEARTLGRLQHPHIVNVFAFRHVEPHLFIVMEYVDGGSLADIIAGRGALPWQEALPIIRQSLDATAYAHRVSVVHRDIKPRNILLTQGGHVKVTDFGLAKIQEATDDSKGLTRTGLTGGTLYYMPPEQLEGLNRVDHRGDIYSLGMTCYELLAGRVPFDKQKSEFTILKAIDAHTFPPLDRLAPDVPKPLAEIVTKALEHDAEDRFQSTEAMLEALDAWSADAGVAAPRPAHETTRVFAWRASPSTKLPVESSPSDEVEEEERVDEEDREKSRGDSSSLLKSLKLLLRDRSGNWRVSDTKDAAAEEPLDAGGDPALQATALAPAPLKIPKPLAKEPARPAPARSASRRSGNRAISSPSGAPRSRGWLRPVGVVAGVAILAALAFLLYPSDTPEAAGGGDLVRAEVSVRTTPERATVLLDGASVGTTPLVNLAVPAGEHALRVTKPGFAALDTTVVVQEGEAPAFTFALVASSGDGAPVDRSLAQGPTEESGVDETEADGEGATSGEAEAGGVIFQSSPSGAEVWLDGRRLGATPYTARDLRPGTHRVEFRREGFESSTTSVRVEAGRTATVAPTLTSLRGTLRVLVRPYGDIYVDGEKKQSESVAPHTEDLPAGTYRVRAVHPVLGTWEKNVTVRGGDRQEILFDFRQTYRVTVVSEPRNATILVDGEAVGRNTPSQVTLRPGRHTLEVRKDGYVMAGQPQTITIERDRTDAPLSFELRAR